MVNMQQHRRFSESPFAEIITKSTTSNKGKLRVIPDGRWDLIITRRNGQTHASIMNGPMLQAALVPYVADEESLVITFTTSAYMTPHRFLKKGVHTLPIIANRAMRIGSDTIEIPTFDNTEAFINQLSRRHLLTQDNVVRDTINRDTVPAWSDRTTQRHFRQITGMTLSYYKQIKRAEEAYTRLSQGEPAINVAYDLTYSDQFHMSKSLKKILGQTPTEIAQQH